MNRCACEPSENCFDCRQAVICGCRARERADPDRDAVAAADFGKAILIGRVVSDKDRPATKKRRFGQEGGNGAPLVRAAGLEFDNHLTRDQAQHRSNFAVERLGNGTDFRLSLRRGAVMKRKRPPFIFEYEAGSIRCEGGKLWPQAIECGRAVAVGHAIDNSVRSAPFEPVQTRCGALPRLEQAVELGQRPTADQGKRSLARGRKPHDQRRQAVWYPNKFRTGSDLQQRPVDIEEQRR